MRGVADKRAFAVFDVGYLDNPKLADILDTSAEAVLMHAYSVLYSAQHLTDGHVPLRRMTKHIGGGDNDVRMLIDAGLWHAGGHECEHCPQPSEGKIYVHDYLEHNRSQSDAKRLSDAGRKANRIRWGQRSRSGSDSDSDPEVNPQTDRQTDSREGAKTAPRKRRLSDDFQPTEAHASKAKELGVNLPLELEKFKNHFIGNGDTKANWSRTFHNWLTRSAEFSNGRPQQQPSFDPWAQDWSEDDYRK